MALTKIRSQSWSAVVKVMTLLTPFNQWEFYVSGEAGNSLFSSKLPTATLFFLVPSPPQSSLPFCAGVQSSRDSIPGAFNDRLKIRENWGLSRSQHSITQAFRRCFIVTQAAWSTFGETVFMNASKKDTTQQHRLQIKVNLLIYIFISLCSVLFSIEGYVTNYFALTASFVD